MHAREIAEGIARKYAASTVEGACADEIEEALKGFAGRARYLEARRWREAISVRAAWAFR